MSQLPYELEMCYLYDTEMSFKMLQGRDCGRLRAPVIDAFGSCEYIIQMHDVLDSKTHFKQTKSSA